MTSTKAIREYFKIMVDDNERVDDNDAPLVNERVLLCDFENIDLSR
jgi:hypothetical protein